MKYTIFYEDYNPSHSFYFSHIKDIAYFHTKQKKDAYFTRLGYVRYFLKRIYDEDQDNYVFNGDFNIVSKI